MAARCMINYENFENLCVIITSLVAIDSTNGLYGDMVIKPLFLAFFFSAYTVRSCIDLTLPL